MNSSFPERHCRQVIYLTSRLSSHRRRVTRILNLGVTRRAAIFAGRHAIDARQADRRWTRARLVTNGLKVRAK